MSVSLGYNESITIDQMISSVRADLGIIDNSFYDILLEKWINEGVRHLGTNQLFVKKPSVLIVSNNRVQLPSDFRRFLGLRYMQDVVVINGDGTTTTTTRCVPLIYIDQQFSSECGCNSNGSGNFLASFEIIGNQIIFKQNVSDGSKVELSYMGFQVDDNCMLIIRPDFERALSAYARVKFLQAYPEVRGNFTMILLREAKQEWINQKRWVKALAINQEFSENKYQIIALAKAWFVRQGLK